jgi:hypothetical protein
MKRSFLAAFLLGVFAFSLLPAPRLSAQSASGTGSPAASSTGSSAASDKDKDAFEWPQFAKDLRRFDVVAFGLFPFAFLVAGIGYDLMRSAQHGWDSAYYPWPVKGSAAWESKDYGNVVLGSAVLSLSVAAIDLAIILIKRHAAAKKEEARSRPESDIRRSPLYEE